MGKSEMVLSKLFSAKWIMSTVTTLAACFIIFYVFRVCAQHDKLEAGVAIVVSFMAIWKEIVMAYFDRDMSNDVKVATPEVKPNGTN